MPFSLRKEPWLIIAIIYRVPFMCWVLNKWPLNKWLNKWLLPIFSSVQREWVTYLKSRELWGKQTRNRAQASGSKACLPFAGSWAQLQPLLPARRLDLDIGTGMCGEGGWRDRVTGICSYLEDPGLTNLCIASAGPNVGSATAALGHSLL